MWQVQTEIIQANKLIKYRIYEQNEPISQVDFLNNLASSLAFRSFYNHILKNNPFSGFYWENPPFNKASLLEPYEFVLIRSSFFKQKSPDVQSFKSYFDAAKPIVIFKNLGKDATLVVPTPQSDASKYIHLGKFVRKAPNNQIDAFWKEIGTTVLELMNEKRIWLNTDGTGVFWLHARLDRYPKYYKPYIKSVTEQ